MLASNSIPQPAYQSKLFKAALLVTGLKWTTQLALAGALLAAALFVFSTIIDCVTEICTHVSEVWTSSSPIERLVILVLAVLFFRILTPVAVRLYRKRGI